ncbi:hypothetical protein ONS95_000456 [Cadophora gregata]|uniref:uncharacterized protein n=1 Tax=Cadophora gregata TaxID=51156 RepID=UPI0026DD246D|nr:uncharacterized protein ONS95_000456 [Cadophora gregata]KAK0128484.1 hypothetical protein ONS95_000456 [Cadophora gregata]
MGGLPNHRFSVEKNREITRFESTLGSLTRRLSLAKNSKETKRSFFNMPQPKNGSDGDSPAGSSQGSAGRYKIKRNGNTPHNAPERADNNEVHSVIGDFLRATRSAQNAIASVDELYRQCANDVLEATENRERVDELKALCRDKDAEIQQCNTALDVMLKRSEDKEVALEDDKAHLDEEKEKFEQMKSDFLRSKQKDESRARELEERITKQAESKLKKDTANLEKNFTERQAKLEKDLKQREADNKKKLTDLEAENKRLSNQVKDLKNQEDSYVKTLALEKEKFEDMEQLRKMSKEEAIRSHKELQMMKEEFGLVSNPPDFFQKRFGDIAKQIHVISTKFCQGLNPNDWASIHGKLKDIDSCFAIVPISDSSDSKLLRTAHTERILSSTLSTLIFRPFSSDSTFQAERKNATNLLEEAALGLEHFGGNRRAAAVLRSLALRGLRSSNQLQAVSAAPSSRTDAFLESVKPVLSLLIPQAQHAKLEDALRNLAKAAISLWDSVQNDEFLDIQASLDLDHSFRSEWSSALFDPDYESNDRTVLSLTCPKIFTLFPNITAKAVATFPEPTVNVPGSFETSKVETQMQEICIHPGVGMCESSALFMKGKDEQEELEGEWKREVLAKELEATEKARLERHKMKAQRHGSVTSLPSPSAEWVMAGENKKLLEQ